MTTLVTTTRGARGALAFLGACAGLLLLATPAHAQVGNICSDIEDVSDDVLDAYLDELEDDFDVDLDDSDLCQALTDNFIKGCQKAVGDALKCVQNQLKALNKQSQTACKALAGDEAKACADSFKNQTKILTDLAKTDAEFESNRCADTLALDYFDVCQFGF